MKKLMLIIPAIAAMLCMQVQAQIQVAGELIVDLDVADLTSGVSNWVNQSTSTDSVGDFADAEGALNVVPALSDASNRVANAVYMGDDNANGLTSATNAPLSVITNNTCTVEAWIFADSGDNGSTIASWGVGNANQQRDFRYEGDPNGMLACYFNVVSWGGADRPVGRWTHVVITYDAATNNNTKGYIDGQLVSTQTLDPLDTLSSLIRIGKGTGGDAFKGYIGDVRIHTGVLGAAAVANNFAEGMAAPADLSPSIIGLEDIEVFEGVDVTFEPTVAGAAPISLQWSTNGVDLAGETNSTLNLPGVTTSMNGNEYTLIAVNSSGAATNSAFLIVNPIQVIAPPAINVDIGGTGNNLYSGTAIAPGAGTVWNAVNNADQQVGVYDSTNGLLESVTLWIRNGNGGLATFGNDSKGDPNPVALMKDYFFPAAGLTTITIGNLPAAEYDLYAYAHGDNPGATGTVTIDAANGGASATQTESSTNDYRNIFVGENYVVLPVIIEESTLQFTANRMSGFQLVPAAAQITGLSDTTAYAGTDLVLDAGASGREPLTYQWYYNDVLLSGKTNGTLTVSGVENAQDGDQYKVIAANELGSATNSMTLSVDPYAAFIDSVAINAASGTATIVWSAEDAAVDAGLTFDILSVNSLQFPTYVPLATNLVSQGTDTNEVQLSEDATEFFMISF